MLLVRRIFHASVIVAATASDGYAAVSCGDIDTGLVSSVEESIAEYSCRMGSLGEPDLSTVHLIDPDFPPFVQPLPGQKQKSAKAKRTSLHKKPLANDVVGSEDRSLRFSQQIRIVSSAFNIDPLLLHAMAHVESRHNPQAISPDGAIGLMQVMPATARRFGMENPDYQLFDPMENLVVSSLYLRVLHRHFGNDLPLVLAAYNAGENAVIRHGRKVPPYRETKEYVRKVMGYYFQLRNARSF